MVFFRAGGLFCDSGPSPSPICKWTASVFFRSEADVTWEWTFEVSSSINIRFSHYSREEAAEKAAYPEDRPSKKVVFRSFPFIYFCSY
ncbi:Hypothetical protein NTJ_04517 [Nesidiocoris tenuis]|uniref:MATH domain-containing protein n=1 Tax=Nesidiocoris tenuis TaxID=355587 RepID=A0ABN7AHH0_9HEMI|nr:Hypothetical protein NTJ_04517 [Nesidiocoris tenuis]